jgi:hypothetical protein
MDKEGKIGKEGKEGLIDINVEPKDPRWSWPVTHVLLFNYNIDGNLIKDEHKEFLDKQLIPFLKANKVHVKLHGTASRSGDPEYNKQLSMERVLRIKKYLTDHGIPESQVPGTQMDWVGSKEANPGDMEDGHDRAVKITIANGLKPKPIIVEKPKGPPRPVFIPGPNIFPNLDTTITSDDPPLPETTEFKIRFVKGMDLNKGKSTKGRINIGVGLGASDDRFEIMDPRTGQTKFFDLVGPNVGAGLGIKGVDISGISLPADNAWSDLQFADPMKLNDFQGKSATFVSVGAGQFALVNRIEFFAPGPNGGTVAANLSTGFTIGAGATVATGVMLAPEQEILHRDP